MTAVCVRGQIGKLTTTDMVFTWLISISVSNNQGDQYLEQIYICSKNKNLNLTKFKFNQVLSTILRDLNDFAG